MSIVIRGFISQLTKSKTEDDHSDHPQPREVENLVTAHSKKLEASKERSIIQCQFKNKGLIAEAHWYSFVLKVEESGM